MQISRRTRTALNTILSVLLFAPAAYAQSPWERVADNIASSFSGPLARSLTIIGIFIGGAMFMFGEHGAMKQIGGIVVGGGMMLFASQFMLWLF